MHMQFGIQTAGMDALEYEASMLLVDLDTHPAARRLFDGSIDASSYAAYLVQTYHYVRWTTPLLAAAGHRMKRMGRPGPLVELLLQKASEERGHERWLLADLKNLGWPTEHVERARPCPAVAAYVAWNRYTTLCGEPLSFLGTAYVLEYLAVQRASSTVERLLAAKKIPNIYKAVAFLRGHGSADEGHVAALASALQSLPDGIEVPTLVLSARITRALYTGLFSEAGAEPAARVLLE